MLCSINEVRYKWVAQETWTFATALNFGPTLLKAAQVDLALVGIDTAADVLINGELVAQLSNAFRCASSSWSELIEVSYHSRLLSSAGCYSAQLSKA